MSGLAAIRALVRAGHAVTAYEAGSAIGGMWRYGNDSGLSAAYASLTTNTSRQRMQYPSFPMPESAPEFPHHTDMLAYLETYARENDLERFISCGAWVDGVRLVEEGWEVTVRERPPRRFDAVVVATGHYWDPHVPELPGRFDGTLIHGRDYRTPDAFSGRHVVVAGAAQSALDIVAEVATTAKRTILSCTEVHHLLPRRVLGRPFDAFDTDAALFVPLSVARTLSRVMMRVSRASPDRGDLPSPRHPLFETRWPAVVSPQAQAAISQRAFESRPRIRELAGD